MLFKKQTFPTDYKENTNESESFPVLEKKKGKILECFLNPRVRPDWSQG